MIAFSKLDIKTFENLITLASCTDSMDHILLHDMKFGSGSNTYKANAVQIESNSLKMYTNKSIIHYTIMDNEAHMTMVETRQ